MYEDENKNLIPVGHYEKPARQEHPAGMELEAYRVHRSGGYDDPAAAGAGFSLRDLLYVIFRHKGKILTMLVLATVLATLYVMSVPTAYESQALLLVRPTRASLAIDPTGEESSSFIRGDRYGGPQVSSEIAMLESTRVAERAVDAVGYERVLKSIQEEPKTGFAARIDVLRDRFKNFLKLQNEELGPRERAIIKVQKSLQVKPAGTRSSNMLQVSITGHTREVAQAVLDSLVNAYVDEHIKAYGIRVSPEVFRKEADRLHEQLLTKQDQIQERLQDLGISSVDNHRTMLVDQIAALDATVRELNAQIEASRARMSVLERVLDGREEQGATSAGGGPSLAMISDPLTDRIRQAILDLKLQEAELETKYTADSKPLSELRARISDYEEMLVKHAEELVAQGNLNGAASAMTMNPQAIDLRLQLDNSRADLEAQIAQQAALSRELGGLRSELAVLSANEKQLRELSMEERTLDSRYQQYLNSLQIAEISEALDESNLANVSVMQPASMPIESTKNNRKLLAILGFGLFMGLGAGIGLAYAIEYFDHSLKTNEDVERHLGLPVLVALPKGRRHLPESA